MPASPRRARTGSTTQCRPFTSGASSTEVSQCISGKIAEPRSTFCGNCATRTGTHGASVIRGAFDENPNNLWGVFFYSRSTKSAFSRARLDLLELRARPLRTRSRRIHAQLRGQRGREHQQTLVQKDSPVRRLSQFVVVSAHWEKMKARLRRQSHAHSSSD